MVYKIGGTETGGINTPENPTSSSEQKQGRLRGFSVSEKKEDLTKAKGNMRKNIEDSNFNFSVRKATLNELLSKKKVYKKESLSDFLSPIKEVVNMSIPVDLVNRLDFVIRDELGNISREKIEGLINELKSISEMDLRDQDVRGEVLKVLVNTLGVLNKSIMQEELFKKIDVLNLKQFKGFKKENLWRLFINAEDQGRGEYGYENEAGYTGGVMRGFTVMLESLDKPLDADGFCKLHDETVKNVYVFDSRNNDFKEFKKDFRNKESVTVGLKYNYNLSEKGEEQLQKAIKSQGKPHFVVVGSPGHGGLMLCVGDKTREENQARANTILERYKEEIVSAGSEDEKLTAMVRCCQDLDQSHLFNDGNIRTIVFVVLNKMLLENGMDPVIMNNPNVFDGFSLQELVEEVKKSQNNFRQYRQS